MVTSEIIHLEVALLPRAAF